MLSFLLTLSIAHAAPAGHYHPLDVAAASSRFAQAQQVAGTTFQARQDEADAYAAALIAYEEALDLLGDRAPAEQRERLTKLRETFERDKRVVGAFASDQLDGFDGAFSAALERALGSREATVCHPTTDRGLRMGPGAHRKETVTCEGDDLNAGLAAKMDADPKLAATLDALLGQTWPAFHLDLQAVPAVGGGTASLDVRRILRDGAGDALAAIDRADDDARLDVRARLEDDDVSADDQRALLDQARRVTATTARRRATLAAPVLDAIDAVAAKAARKTGVTVGWCAQPAVLGGCATPPVDPAVEAAWLDSGKVARALATADAVRP
ncbi:MAG: hypothetical protein H6733_15330 [Alphaproteobacteria bacterium]|nr:hypothetical protein [Alphaproteobacteria bacterium]